jgi:hypothetical protein
MFVNFAAPGESWLAVPWQFRSASEQHEQPAGDTWANGLDSPKSMAKPALSEEFLTWAPASTAIAIAQKVGSYMGLVDPSMN